MMISNGYIAFLIAPLDGIASGDMTIKGVESDVNSDFSDILSNLNGAFTVHFDTAWNQKRGGVDLISIRSASADTSQC